MLNGKATKKTALSLSLIAILAVGLFILAPIATAHNPPITIPNYAYVSAFPNPATVGQPISLFAWTATYPFTAQGEYGDRWTNLQIIVTAPDGTNTTLGPFTSDPVGTIFASFTPTTTGNYSFQFHMPAYKFVGYNSAYPVTPPNQVTGSQYINDTIAEAWSVPEVVQVTDQPVQPAPFYPLPTDYWTAPVSMSGHESWANIMGDWLAATVPGSNINDNTQPPTTAHIVWTKPINFGGVGGQPLAINSGGDYYYSYLSYEGMYTPPIVLGGRLYYNTPNPPEYGFQCVDLRTGQLIWYNNGTQDPLAQNNINLGFGFSKQNYPQLSFGQELDYESPNQHGLIPYLWATYTAKNGSSVWAMYDPFSGNWICDIVGVPASSAIFGASSMFQDQIGSFIIFSASPDFKTITVWNSTQCIQNTNPSLSTSNGYWMWRPPLGQVVSANSGLTVYNTTGVPAQFQKAGTVVGPFGPSFSNSMGLSLLGIDAQKQIAIYSNATAVLGEASFPTNTGIAFMGISIAPQTLGQYLWNNIQPFPQGNITLLSGPAGDGAFAIYEKETTTWIGYNSTTGAQIWTSQPETALHSYGVTSQIYNNVLYSGDSIGEGGIVYAYDITTGNLTWSSAPISMGNTGYWALLPRSVATFSAGNIYWYGSEHSPGPVLEPGFKIGDINATTGADIWNITFWNAGGGIGAGLPISQGYMPLLNAYDNQIYTFGKGPTQIKLQTPSIEVASGQNVILQGSVMDISAGTQQSGGLATRFPNGVPAVADADQTAWMEYLYMQNAAPSSVGGVPVTLTFIDSNGNMHQDTTTTDGLSGTFNYVVPSSMIPVSGKYIVTASFPGSGAYWPSTTTSALLVGTGAATSPTPTPTTPTTMVDTYFLPAVIIIVILLLIGIALLAVMLRRRP